MSTFYTCIYKHTLRLVRDTGVSSDQGQFTVLSLLCSNVTISRNQISSLSILNKYIFTVNQMRTS